jgi:hypothetical protein
VYTGSVALPSALACRTRPHQRAPSRRQRIAFAPRCENVSTTRTVRSGRSTGAAAGGATLFGKPLVVMRVEMRRPFVPIRTRLRDVSSFASWIA